MGPEPTTAGDACMDFVNDQVDAHLLGHSSELICKEAGDMMISTSRLDWLNDDGCDLDTLVSLPGLYLLFDIAEGGQILFLVVGFIGGVADRVTVGRWLSHGPVEGGDVDLSEGADFVRVPRR